MLHSDKPSAEDTCRFKPGDNTAIIISARDMSQKERKSYARK